MIPTMTLRMPSRINEVDVCLNMKGTSFRLAQPRHGISEPRCLSVSADAMDAAAGQHLPAMEI